MWSGLSFQWRACVSMAWEGYCAGTYPIGAIITNPTGGVLATGRNRVFAPREPAHDYLSGTSLAHAEVNALYALDNTHANPRECILYTTTEPCPMCAGAIVMANVREVHYAARDPWAGSTALFETSPYMRSKGMRTLHEPGEGSGAGAATLEGVLFAMQTAFFVETQPPRPGVRDRLAEAMAEIHPAGTQLGLDLGRQGKLTQLRAAGCPIREIVDTLAGMLGEGA